MTFRFLGLADVKYRERFHEAFLDLTITDALLFAVLNPDKCIFVVVI